MSYQNLKAEMKRSSITQKDVADLLGMSVNNASLKINERVPFTLEEAKLVHRSFFEDARFEYLFESDGDVPTDAERELSSIETIEDIAREEKVGSPVVLETIAEMKRKAIAAVEREKRDQL